MKLFPEHSSLTLFRPGELLRPPPTLHACNFKSVTFCNSKGRFPNLVTFLKIDLETVWYDLSLVVNLHVSIYSERRIFKFCILLFVMKKNNFLPVTFTHLIMFGFLYLF